ncbi:MAG: hypothetical protein ACTSYL_03375 [Candidatus Thorarchaeota archaeon]
MKKMSQMDTRHVTYYLVFLGGLGLVGYYMFNAFTTFGINDLMDLLFLGSAGLFWLTTFIVAFVHSRPLRLIFTIGSGSIAGAHYLLATMFYGQTATLWFMVLGLGVVLSCSTFIWLRE